MIQHLEDGKKQFACKYLLGTFPRLSGQPRITYAVATFARFMKNILGVNLILIWKKYHNNNTNLLKSSQYSGKKIVLKSLIKMWKII